MSEVSSANVDRYAPGLALIRRSSCPSAGSSCVRANSRNLRFNRLRAIIRCLYFGTTTPIRGLSNREAAARASRWSVCMRFPVRRTASRSASFVSLWLRGKPKPSRAGVLGRQLDSKPFASLLATAAKNFTSPSGCHPEPETVSPDAAFVAGTVGGLAHYDTPETNKIFTAENR